MVEEEPKNLSQKINNSGMIYMGDVKNEVIKLLNKFEDNNDEYPAKYIRDKIKEGFGEYLI